MQIHMCRNLLMTISISIIFSRKVDCFACGANYELPERPETRARSAQFCLRGANYLAEQGGSIFPTAPAGTKGGLFCICVGSSNLT